MAECGRVVVLGVFAADATYRVQRLPRMGETIHGESFTLGPGGKGSNQAIAAAKLGAEVHFITRLGDDAFADLAEATWRAAGVRPLAPRDPGHATGSAGIMVDAASGDNAIVVCPGAAAALSTANIERHAATIRAADVFVTQLEQPLEAARDGLAAARDAGVTTILNPAPAADLGDDLLALCDWITPNETEAGALTGIEVTDDASAERAARALVRRGVRNAVVTLGERGALAVSGGDVVRVDAYRHAPVVETTGAGDAFNGAFATGLARGLPVGESLRLGCVVAGLSVTRAGAAASMPERAEVESVVADLAARARA